MPDEQLHQNLYDDLSFAEHEATTVMSWDMAKRFFPVHEEPPIGTMDEPVIIESACPGWQPGGDHYPAVPMNPDEVVEEVVDSVEAGAAAIHVHPRDEAGVTHITNEDLLVDTLDGVFDAVGDVLTLSHTWMPATPDNPHANYVDETASLLERGDGNKYCQGALVLPPGHRGAAYNSLSSVREAVRYFEQHDIKPVFQLYDSHVISDLNHHVFETGDATWKPYVLNINLGKHHAHNIAKDPWSYLQLIAAMNTVRETVPNSIVNVFAGGRNWLPITVLGLIAGANVFRVGIEDAYWLYPHRDDLIPKNSSVVALVKDFAEMLGREVITDFDEARDFLGIKYTSPR